MCPIQQGTLTIFAGDDSSASDLQVFKRSVGYYGGGADQLHVHVIKGDAHVKLGPNKRINIVKQRQRHSGASRIYEELAAHPRGPVLKPWVDAAFRFYGV